MKFKKGLKAIEKAYESPTVSGSDSLGQKTIPKGKIPYLDKRPLDAPRYDWYKRKKNSLPNDKFLEKNKPYNNGGNGSNKGGGGFPKGSGGSGGSGGNSGGSPLKSGSPLQRTKIPVGAGVGAPITTPLGALNAGLGVLGAGMGALEAAGNALRGARNTQKSFQNLLDELQGKEKTYKPEDFEYEAPWFDWLLPQNKKEQKTGAEPIEPNDPFKDFPETFTGEGGKTYNLTWNYKTKYTNAQGQTTYEVDSNGGPVLMYGPVKIYSVSFSSAGEQRTNIIVQGGNGYVLPSVFGGSITNAGGSAVTTPSNIVLTPTETDGSSIPSVVKPYATYEPIAFDPLVPETPTGKGKPIPESSPKNDKKGDKLSDWFIPFTIPLITGRGTPIPSNREGKSPEGQKNKVPETPPVPTPQNPAIPERAPDPNPTFYPGTPVIGLPVVGSPGGGTGGGGSVSGSATVPAIDNPTQQKKKEEPKLGFNPADPFPIPIIPIPRRIDQSNPGTGTNTGGNTGTGTGTDGKTPVCKYDSLGISGKVDAANTTLNAVQIFQEQQIMGKLDKISRVTGAEPGVFPATLPLLTGDKSEVVRNLPELVLYVVKNIDAVTGLFPTDVEFINGDGNKQKVRLESLGHAIEELFGAMLIIGEDADAAVNIAARTAIEAIQSKISARQAGETSRAIAKFLGFAGEARQRTVKIGFTPSATGLNNKLENQEMADFLKPSTQNYIGYECVENDELLPIIKRVLEDSEIARSALYHPLKQNPQNKDEYGVTGEYLRGNKKPTEKDKKAWEAYKKFIQETTGAEITDKEIKRKPGEGDK